MNCPYLHPWILITVFWFAHGLENTTTPADLTEEYDGKTSEDVDFFTPTDANPNLSQSYKNTTDKKTHGEQRYHVTTTMQSVSESYNNTTDTPCSRDDTEGCVFPFTHDGKEYNGCAFDESGNYYWCRIKKIHWWLLKRWQRCKICEEEDGDGETSGDTDLFAPTSANQNVSESNKNTTDKETRGEELYNVTTTMQSFSESYYNNYTGQPGHDDITTQVENEKLPALHPASGPDHVETTTLGNAEGSRLTKPSNDKKTQLEEIYKVTTTMQGFSESYNNSYTGQTGHNDTTIQAQNESLTLPVMHPTNGPGHVDTTTARNAESRSTKPRNDKRTQEKELFYYVTTTMQGFLESSNNSTGQLGHDDITIQVQNESKILPVMHPTNGPGRVNATTARNAEESRSTKPSNDKGTQEEQNNVTTTMQGFSESNKTSTGPDHVDTTTARNDESRSTKPSDDKEMHGAELYHVTATTRNFSADKVTHRAEHYNVTTTMQSFSESYNTFTAGNVGFDDVGVATAVNPEENRSAKPSNGILLTILGVCATIVLLA